MLCNFVFMLQYLQYGGSCNKLTVSECWKVSLVFTFLVELPNGWPPLQIVAIFLINPTMFFFVFCFVLVTFVPHFHFLSIFIYA